MWPSAKNQAANLSGQLARDGREKFCTAASLRTNVRKLGRKVTAGRSNPGPDEQSIKSRAPESVVKPPAT
jgi:hypothetical protein